jgi:hypothetical protein
VDQAIDRGVQYLLKTQAPRGTWAPRTPHHVSLAALPALTLLECGVSGDEPPLQKAARHVRAAVPTLQGTYELALAILFLDRLGQPRDRPLIRTLALRLAAGQGPDGGWTYRCPLLTREDESTLLASLRRAGTAAVESEPGEASDNSNTQFAVLGLWAARRHGLPLEQSLARVAQRFRRSQNPARGWAYRFVERGGRLTPSMTCAGLLGLAVDPALNAKPTGPDAHIEDAFKVLGQFIGRPLGWARPPGGNPAIHLYFLWSLERTAVLYNRRRIQGKDWYRWGAELLVGAQVEDGSWNAGGYPGATPIADTCFALLFLKRANLTPDLTRKLELLSKITESPGRRR